MEILYKRINLSSGQWVPPYLSTLNPSVFQRNPVEQVQRVNCSSFVSVYLYSTERGLMSTTLTFQIFCKQLHGSYIPGSRSSVLTSPKKTKPLTYILKILTQITVLLVNLVINDPWVRVCTVRVPHPVTPESGTPTPHPRPFRPPPCIYSLTTTGGVTNL